MTTAGCHDCRTLLGGYVLHALEPDEVETVRRHLATCEACSAEYDQLAGIPATLDAAGPGETPIEQPPAALEEAVLDRFAREHRAEPTPPQAQRPEGQRPEARQPGTPRRRFAARLRRPLPAAFAGAAVAAAITAAVIALPNGGGGDNPRYAATLAGSASAPGATASADLTVGASGTRVRLHVRDLNGTPAAVYELWCLREDGTKVSAGTFRTDGHGRADVSLTTAAVPGEYHRLSVERHPGQRVMTGEIEYPHS